MKQMREYGEEEERELEGQIFFCLFIFVGCREKDLWVGILNIL